MKIAIGSDHRGVELKEAVIKFLQTIPAESIVQDGKETKKEEAIDNKALVKIEVKDFGPHNKDSCDYPDFGFQVSNEVANGNFDFGILICNSGLGMSIVANKVSGIRAALCTNELFAEYARVHNDANVLVLSAEFVSSELAEKIITKWINSRFEGGRHKSRLDKIRVWEEHFIEKVQAEEEIEKFKKEARKWQSRAWKG